jgi:hypothetical protein
MTLPALRRGQPPLGLRAVGLAVVAFSLLPARSFAELKTAGKGKEQRLVAEQFPAEQKTRLALFEQRCSHCHELARPISALLTGLTPISSSVFDSDGVKTYVVKMMRKPNSGIDKEDAKELIAFLSFARQLAKAGK